MMTYPNTYLQAHLAAMGACPYAREWAATKPAQEAWETCDRADWLLWWAGNTAVNSKQDLVRCAVKIARTVAHLNADPRVMAAIEAAEAWAANPNADTALAALAARAAAEAAARAEAAEKALAAAARAAALAALAAIWAASEWADMEASVWAAASWVATKAKEAEPANYCGLIRATLKQPWAEIC